VIGYGASGVAENVTINDDFDIRGFRSLGALRNGAAKPSFKRSPTFGIERIEVIKSPAAMLTGNNNYLGGAVNFISRKPKETAHGDVSLALADNNFIRSEHNATGPLYTGKVGGGKFSLLYNVVLDYWNDDKWKDIEGRDDTYVGGGLRLLFGGKTTITIEAFHFTSGGYEYDTDIWDPLAAAAGLVLPNPYTDRHWSPGRAKDAFWDIAEYNYSLEVVHAFSENSSVRVYFVRVDGEDRRQHLTGDASQADNLTINRSVLPIDIDNIVNNFQLDFIQKLETGPISHDISIGVDNVDTFNLQRLDYYTVDPIDARNPDFSNDDVMIGQHVVTWIANRTQETQALSYYIQENAKMFDDKLIAACGVRWIDSKQDTHNLLNGRFTTTNAKRFTAHKMGLVYKPTKDLSLYATDVATKFVITRGALNVGTIWEEPSRDSEGRLREVDVKFTLLNGALYGSTAYFDMARTAVLSDRNVIDPATTLSRRIEAYSDDTSKGWEIDLGYRWLVSDVARLDMPASFFSGEYLTATGDPTLNTPKQSGGFLGKLSFVGGVLKRFIFGGGLHHQSEKIYIGLKNKWPPTADLFATYTWNEKMAFQLNVDNATDERYIITSTEVSQVSDPRRIRFQVRYLWCAPT